MPVQPHKGESGVDAACFKEAEKAYHMFHMVPLAYVKELCRVNNHMVVRTLTTGAEREKKHGQKALSQAVPLQQRKVGPHLGTQKMTCPVSVSQSDCPKMKNSGGDRS